MRAVGLGLLGALVGTVMGYWLAPPVTVLWGSSRLSFLDAVTRGATMSDQDRFALQAFGLQAQVESIYNTVMVCGVVGGLIGAMLGVWWSVASKAGRTPTPVEVAATPPAGGPHHLQAPVQHPTPTPMSIPPVVEAISEASPEPGPTRPAPPLVSESAGVTSVLVCLACGRNGGSGHRFCSVCGHELGVGKPSGPKAVAAGLWSVAGASLRTAMSEGGALTEPAQQKPFGPPARAPRPPEQR